MTPPFSSPRASRIPPGSPKNRCRRLKLEIKMQRKFGYVLGAVLCRKRGQHGPNLGSKMEPKSAKNHEKIDAKIDRKIDASWDQVLEGF